MSVQEKSSNNSRTLIVYYSLEGNTEYAASRISEICGFDMLRLSRQRLPKVLLGREKCCHGGDTGSGTLWVPF